MSILNALATGKGGALSIGLATRAKVRISGKSVARTSHKLIQNGSFELSEVVVRRTLEHYGYNSHLHCEVETSSDIPTGVGLKSSSAAANAVALATAAAIGEDPQDKKLVEIGMDASIESNVSLTGAFDDSFASYYGGAVLTDNQKRMVEMIPEITRDLRILVLVPGTRKASIPLEASNYSSIKRISELAHDLAIKGKTWDALSLNGLAFSTVLGQDPRPALAAIDVGALGAGLSGKGPASAAIATANNSERVRRSLETFGGRVIETRPNFTKAEIKS